MKFFAIASALVACASTATAAVTKGCVTSKQAQLLVSRFSTLQTKTNSDLGNWTTTATAILVKNYQEISDSILSLEQQPLGGVTFDGRANYINGLDQAPPVGSVNTLGVYLASCSKVLWQWHFSGVGTGEYEVKGFNLFTLNREGQITQTELEFNSVAWGIDIFQLPCGNATASDSSGSTTTTTPPATTS